MLKPSFNLLMSIWPSIIESENRKESKPQKTEVSQYLKLNSRGYCEKCFLELPLSGDNCQYC